MKAALTPSLGHVSVSRRSIWLLFLSWMWSLTPKKFPNQSPTPMFLLAFGLRSVTEPCWHEHLFPALRLLLAMPPVLLLWMSGMTRKTSPAQTHPGCFSLPQQWTFSLWGLLSIPHLKSPRLPHCKEAEAPLCAWGTPGWDYSLGPAVAEVTASKQRSLQVTWE